MKIVEVKIDSAAIYRKKEEIILLPLKNGSRISGVMYSFGLYLIWDLHAQVAHDDNNFITNALQLNWLSVFVHIVKNFTRNSYNLMESGCI